MYSTDSVSTLRHTAKLTIAAAPLGVEVAPVLFSDTTLLDPAGIAATRVPTRLRFTSAVAPFGSEEL